MLKHYWKVVLRNITKSKFFSFINILGLAIGITCCILFLLFLTNELNYNKNHVNREQLQFVSIQIKANNSIQKLPVPPTPLGPYLKSNYPEIINFCRVKERLVVVKSSQNNLNEEKVIYCDPSIFEMFTLPFVSGNIDKSKEDPTVVVVSEAIAKKYFEKGNTPNRTLTIDNKVYNLAGVFKNIPYNTELQADIIIPFQTNIFNIENNWAAPGQNLWIQLKRESLYKEVEAKIANVVSEHAAIPNVEFKLFLHPLSDIHLYGWDGGNGVKYLIILSLVAFGILLIACINYINLATARSTLRAKEIGVRKVLGATKKILFKQLLIESIIYSFLALVIALIFSAFLISPLNSLVDKKIGFHLLDVNLIIALFGVTLFTGIMAGGYTAFILSSFSPVRLLNSGWRSGKKVNLLRKGLVVVQFTIAIILLSSIVIINRQYDHLQNKNLGYNKDELVYIPLKSANVDENTQRRLIFFKNELSNKRIFKNTSLGTLPFGDGALTGNINWENKPSGFEILFYTKNGDKDYVKTINLSIIKGRDFSGDVTLNTLQEFLINEAAAKLMGFTDPVGKRLILGNREGTIVGVVKNFNFQSLYNTIEPVVISYSNYRPNLLVQTQMPITKSTIDLLKKVWNKYMPDIPFEYHFAREVIEQQYVEIKKMNTILGYLTSIAVFISCLGLIGLISLSINQSSKEIAIRKIVGASVPNILVLLTKNFTKLILFANLIALPIAWYIMQKWLQDFAYQIDLTMGPFLFAGFSAIVIALITISFQAIKAATANPVESLRYE